ncbi:MAG: guanylate kinase [Nitrospirota bacterium]
MVKNPRKRNAEGELYIISAPSGVGKTTLCQKLIKTVPRLEHSVSYTTRSPRKGEINNVHYTFISKNKFKAMINRGEFAEWAVVHGNLYGTSAKRLKEKIKKGYDIILDIDTQGAMQMRRRVQNASYIFVLPPSMKILKKRLHGRMSESSAEIKNRLKKSKDEIASYRNYDYIVVNDDFKKALRDLEFIVMSKRLMTNKVSPGWIKRFVE